MEEQSSAFNKMFDHVVYDVFVGVMSLRSRVVIVDLVSLPYMVGGFGCCSLRVYRVGAVELMGKCGVGGGRVGLRGEAVADFSFSSTIVCRSSSLSSNVVALVFFSVVC